MMVGRLVSFWEGLFLGAMLNFRGVKTQTWMEKPWNTPPFCQGGEECLTGNFHFPMCFCSWWSFCWVFFGTSNISIHKTTPKSVSKRSTLQVFLGICEFSRIFETQKTGIFSSVSPRMPIQTGRSFSPLSTQRECHGENFKWQDPENWATLKNGTLVV